MTERYAQQRIKERNRRVVLKHWWRFGLMALAVGVVAFSIWLIAPGLEVPLWGVIPAMCLGGLGVGWDQLAGTTNLVNGRDAEKWTSKELRKVCGPGWHVVDGIPFAFYDIDHVLVGPGGVYAIETKYTDSEVDLASRRGQGVAARWVGQALEGARSIRLLLRDLHVGEVYAGVIVWGGEISGNPIFVDGIAVLRPRDLDASFNPWRRDLDLLSQDKVDQIVDALTAFRDMRVRYDQVAARRAAALQTPYSSVSP